MAGVIMEPRFAVTRVYPTDTTQAVHVAVEMDEQMTALFLTAAQARRMAKGLLREADRIADGS